jgi:hypothetical protein
VYVRGGNYTEKKKKLDRNKKETGENLGGGKKKHCNCK